MKQYVKSIISFIISLIIIVSCATTTPLWVNIGRKGVYVNTCIDTMSIKQLDSIMNVQNINYYAWPKAIYTGQDTITQYTRVKGDTIFSITISTAHKDTCVYNIRCFKENIENSITEITNEIENK